MTNPTWLSLLAPGGLLAGAIALAGPALGCAPLSGAPSLTVLAAETPKGMDPTAAPIEERACTTWAAVFFFWGDSQSHESLVGRALARTQADALVEAQAESSTYGFPYVFLRHCETVRGRPARRTAARTP